MKFSKGFSLVELLIALTIVVVISGIAYGQLERSWASGRDAVRIETVEKIAVAVDLWQQEYGRDPDCPGGIKIEDVDIASMAAADIQTDLILGGPAGGTNDVCPEAVAFHAYIESVLGEIPTDPLGPGNPDHFYYYDGGHNCDFFDTDPTIMDSATMVYAANLETQDSNVLEYCVTPSGNDGGLLNTTDYDYGGTKNPSQPYMTILKRQING